jgi:predicted dehydrogenase
MNVKVIGAGSIGNHLANACVTQGLHVTIVDNDKEALNRTKNIIYPERYGKWNEDIVLAQPDMLNGMQFDIIIIGTPPASHLSLAIEEIRNNPKAILIEKPLCGITDEEQIQLDTFKKLLKESDTKVFVGYNHTITDCTLFTNDIIKSGSLGNPIYMDANIRENWGGILDAHPWLKGPEDSYLGSIENGGGACLEHSHGVNIFQHFLSLLNVGNIKSVSCKMKIIKGEKLHYDELCSILVDTDTSFHGRIVQDVVTKPTEKYVHIVGDKGFLKWYINYDSNNDAVKYHINGKEHLKLFPKTRPDDFKNEIKNIVDVLDGNSVYSESPINFKNAVNTHSLILSSFESNETNKVVYF